MTFTDPAVGRYATDRRGRAGARRFPPAQRAGQLRWQPALDLICGREQRLLSTAARAAELIGAGQAFDPYANDQNAALNRRPLNASGCRCHRL